MMPYVIILSEGNVTAQEVKENIIKAKGSSDVEDVTKIHTDLGEGHQFDIKTKYYENSIVLIPTDRDITAIDCDSLRNVEALIVYFDNRSKDILAKIRLYCDFLQHHDIENGLILFDNLYCNDGDNISYKDISGASNFKFDIVELNAAVEAPVYEDESITTAQDYDDVLQALYCFVWSNIQRKEEDADNSIDGRGSAQSNIETDIDMFENLLKKIQTFKSVSSTLEREDVLKHAEKLATQFVQLINNDREDGE